MEIINDIDLSKKPLAKALVKYIELKKKNHLKENDSTSVLGLVNEPIKKDLKHKKSNK